MITLKETILKAHAEKRAIGHFNFSNLETFKAIVASAQATAQPVILGLSEGERNFIGPKTARALVDNAKQEFGLDLYLNADHVHSLESAKVALEAGFDSITFDRGEVSLEQNIIETKALIDLVRASYPNVLIEGELGFIGHSSEVLTAVPEGAAVSGLSLTTTVDAKRLVDETGIDFLAPAVGNIHGIVSTGEPKLDLDRIKDISLAIGRPLVLHGASGNSIADLEGAIKAGVSIIHLNTEIRLAWRDNLLKDLKALSNEVASYKLSAGAVEAMTALITAKIKLFARQ
ncbi:MAG: tagatose-bisphosphate aldolase [Candidatus Vogelbacteria bacterium CG22_combo_CG10-13_8_21_14_all_37_9]|uniref:Tagatose-bisphosphate aldolase n=1 Tax=Candidatus Vogelbacteria bacterium CG22_combo_CG10-13_8_21_14_all_37_9 TaxID=1975046 RepID=A0A2H0BL16_9BACT|nr:MAG: hypothetical protein BK005_00180 [bacterium CG10_37_50]PIP58377.1 MAG: tagatose-bisphosphate aldolase [Candidatus Vogelbacteria bacterium CG22_combo_CG10-13_8_21_14_all_37_9]